MLSYNLVLRMRGCQGSSEHFTRVTLRAVADGQAVKSDRGTTGKQYRNMGTFRWVLAVWFFILLQSPNSVVMAVVLGSQCSTNTDCTASIENSECTVDKCACSPGYLPSASNNVCNARKCVSPQAPPNGKVTSTDPEYKYQSTATLECDLGYLPGGDSSQTCGPNGNWVGSALICNDVNECSTCAHDCMQICTNTNGSYTCSCNPGYYSSGNNCTACDSEHWGDNCTNTFSCNSTNTADRSSVHGCVCSKGWGGADCGTDIDECEEDSHGCPAGSYCNNTRGGRTCTCHAGYVTVIDGCLATIGAVCFQPNLSCSGLQNSVCDNVTSSCRCNHGYYGESGTRTCTRVTVGADCSQLDQICTVIENGSCHNASKTCTCADGHYGAPGSVTCTADVDECSNGTHNCSQRCVNTVGGYNCSCNTGFSGSGNNCTACDEDHWGDDCTNTFTCNVTNTVEKSPTSGCVCKPGWRGVNCETDKNECQENTHDCPAHSHCNNTRGGWTCTCNTGYDTVIAGCIACSSHKYGPDCSQTCDCTTNHSASSVQSCDHVNGTCLCKPGWSGARCDVDVDECTTNTHACTGANEGCYNTQGGYKCTCLRGYSYDDNRLCKKDAATTASPTSGKDDSVTAVGVSMKLNISLDNTNLSLSLTYSIYEQELLSKIKDIYKKRLPGKQIDVIIHDIRKGSLIVNYTLTVPNNSIATVTVVNMDIAAGTQTLDVFGTTAVATSMTVDDETVVTGVPAISASSICKLYVILNGPCKSPAKCTILANLEPGCQIPKKGGRFDLIMGLGVGIPLSLIAVLVLLTSAILYYKNKARPRRTTQKHRNSFSHGKFIEHVPVRVESSAYKPYPNYWFYTEDGLVSVPSDTEKRGVYWIGDSSGPTSRSSKDVFYSYYQPARGYKVDRPSVHTNRSQPIPPRL